MGQSTWETTQAPGGSIIIMLPTKAVVGFLATLAIAEAAKLNEDSLYHVVEDLPANETVEASDENVATCFDIMARNGLNFSSFWHGAAHGLHSLHLEEIRHFFEPNASENNKIPVVNKNFSSKQTILFDAPLAGYDEHFNTMALKVMSYFMLNDHPDFFQQGVNTLEKLTHQYHMHEIYAAAAPIYNAMKENPPSDPGQRPPRASTLAMAAAFWAGPLIYMYAERRELQKILNLTKPRSLIWSKNTSPTPLTKQLSAFWTLDHGRPTLWWALSNGSPTRRC